MRKKGLCLALALALMLLSAPAYAVNAAPYGPLSISGGEASLSFDAAVSEQRTIDMIQNPLADWADPNYHNELKVRMVTVQPGSKATVAVVNRWSGEVYDNVQATTMVPDGAGYYYAYGFPDEDGVMEFVYAALKTGDVDEWFRDAAEGTLFSVTIRDDRFGAESVYIGYGEKEKEDDPYPGNTTQFTDLVEGAYYFGAISWAVEKGITNGTTPTTFSPDAICNRGQVATFLWRAAGSPKPGITKNPCRDVKASSPFYSAILWACEQGITNGTTADTFSPANPCTRAHVLTFLWRAAGQPTASTTGPLARAYPGRYYTPALAWAEQSGLLSGTGPEYKGGSTFRPDDPCPRADVVTYLYRGRQG